MNGVATFLKVAAAVPILVGGLHLILGLNADVLLGAKLPASVIADPVLDSQNRFYGVAFMLFGLVLFAGGSDLKRYLPVVRGALWIRRRAGTAVIRPALRFSSAARRHAVAGRGRGYAHPVVVANPFEDRQLAGGRPGNSGPAVTLRRSGLIP
jgi:hypothetical protein